MGRKNAFGCNRELGAELRKRREAAGLTGKELALHTGWHSTTISRIESGYAGISMVDLMHYLGPCKVYLPEAQELLKLCEAAERNIGYWLTPQGEWLDSNLGSLVFHESTATEVIAYDPLVINGLLQTADYARVLMSRYKRDDAVVKRGVATRLARQRILSRPRPARFTFFAHEQALRLKVGSDAVSHDQLLQVVLLAALPHVTIRVVPTSAGDRGMFGGPFHLFSYERHQPLVFLPSPACSVFIEDMDFVTPYRGLVAAMADVALDEGQSREFVAALANEHDRERPERHAAIYQLEEEQL